MCGEITVKNNTIEQTNFDMYRVVRMNEAPKSMEIHFVKPADKQPPGGLGEPGTAVVQPAIANAIFAATGKRVRASAVDAGEHPRGVDQAARRMSRAPDLLLAFAAGRRAGGFSVHGLVSRRE